MSKNNLQVAVPEQFIASKIYSIRSQRVMLDSDLAEIYGVTTKVLNQAIKRNIDRFPEDFMFQLSEDEFENLRSQIVTGSQKHRDPRFAPYAFTEHGTLMVSSVLNSKRAADVNIIIIRTFVKLREMLATHKDVERKIKEHDAHISNLYAHLERLLQSETTNKNPIGYIWDKE